MDAEFLQLGSVRIRHAAAGEGEPVVLLHGLGRSLEDWSETVPQIERAAEFADLVLDFLGARP